MGNVGLRKTPVVEDMADISSVMRDADYAVPPFMCKLLYSVAQMVDYEKVSINSRSYSLKFSPYDNLD